MRTTLRCSHIGSISAYGCLLFETGTARPCISCIHARVQSEQLFVNGSLSYSIYHHHHHHRHRVKGYLSLYETECLKVCVYMLPEITLRYFTRSFLIRAAISSMMMMDKVGNRSHTIAHSEHAHECIKCTVLLCLSQKESIRMRLCFLYESTLR